MTILRGIYPALITPLDRQDEVNEAVLRRIVELHIRQGVDGLFVCGGTGQGLLLSVEERKQVVAAVIDQARGRIRIIAHVGAITTASACDLAEHAAASGVDAIAAIPPIYYLPDPPALRAYYQAIAQAGGLPTWIYHIPHNTQVSFTPALVDSLFEIEQLAGIKYTSSDLFSMEQIVELGRARCFTVHSGLDDLCLPALTMGAHGAIGSTFNLLAPLFVGLYRSFTAGDLSSARHYQAFANRIIRALASVPLLTALYYAMRHLDLDCGHLRQPLRPLSRQEEQTLNSALAQAGLFEWLESQAPG